MKLLILTQKVDRNDAVLGFFHRWILEFAKHYEHIVVICLEEGVHDLPKNVSVYSLGKEAGVSKVTYLVLFYSHIWRLRRQYDHIFVHMNSEYVVLGGLLWRAMGKCIALWYTHRQAHWKLRIAARFAHVIFSASGYSFTVRSNKLQIVRHGIDTSAFACKDTAFHTPLSIISVGRITPIKNPDTLIEAAHILTETWQRPFTITLYGTPSDASDRRYKQKLEELIDSYQLGNVVHFAGDVPNHEMPTHYCNADVAVNLTPTGGIDKAVLEAMSAHRLVLVSNKAFEEHFENYAPRLVFSERDPQDLAEKLTAVAESDDVDEIRKFLQEKATMQFDVTTLIPMLAKELRTVCAR